MVCIYTLNCISVGILGALENANLPLPCWNLMTVDFRHVFERNDKMKFRIFAIVLLSFLPPGHGFLLIKWCVTPVHGVHLTFLRDVSVAGDGQQTEVWLHQFGIRISLTSINAVLCAGGGEPSWSCTTASPCSLQQKTFF